MRRHTLLIDADDTLWENNVFFEKLIEDFISIVEPCGYTRAYIRHILNETERKNIRQYGYGVRSFGRSLEETYIKLAEQMAKRETLALIHSRVVELERTPPKILDGVPETLAYLTERHRLILFTKGEPAEQAAKVQRSGLQGFLDRKSTRLNSSHLVISYAVFCLKKKKKKKIKIIEVIINSR